jgi:integrase
MRCLTPQEAGKLLTAARGDRLEALYIMAVRTGMRQGELFGLRWDDIDFRNRRVSVRRSLQEASGKMSVVEPKTSSGRRVIDLDDETVAALVRRRELSWMEAAQRSRRNEDPRLVRQRKSARTMDVECPWVFAGYDGKLPRRSNVRRRSFEPLLERAKLGRLRFHDLRHTAATLMLAAGVHPKIVSDRLGHASVTITLDRYSHVLPGMGRDAADRTAAFLERSLQEKRSDENDGEGAGSALKRVPS